MRQGTIVLKRLSAHKGFRCTLYIVGLYVFFSMSVQFAHAQVFDQITDGYKSASAGWFAPMDQIARSLFWKLAAIEFAWSAIVWALQQENMQSFTSVVVKKIMGIGFFFFILSNASYWIPAIVNSLKKSGQMASGTNELTPSEVFDTGIDIANVVLTGLHDKSLFTDFMTVVVGGLAALLVVIAFLIITGQLIIALIESYIVISAGVLFLGFGGSRWTTDFTQKYISYAFATGIKLLMLYLIIGVGMQQANTWAALLADNTFTNILTVMGGAMLLAFLAFQIPNMAAGMLSGAPSMTAGAAAGTMGAIAAGTVAAGASVASPAMQSARGGMQALKAGYDHHRAEGSGVLASAAKAVGTSTVDYGREAARSGAEMTGLARPTESRSMTIGGRAAETRQSATDTLREEQAAYGGTGGGKPVSPPSGASNKDASNTSASSSSASNNSASNTSVADNGSPANAQGAQGGVSAQDAATAVAEGQPVDKSAAGAGQGGAAGGGQGASSVAQAATRQASDTMVDNAPQKLGSAAAQSTATNTSASNPSASNTSVGDKPILGGMSQVRPPNIPNDAAPQAGVSIRLSHSED